MTATKRITRIGAIFLLVIFLVSSMATMAMAAKVDKTKITSNDYGKNTMIFYANTSKKTNNVQVKATNGSALLVKSNQSSTGAKRGYWEVLIYGRNSTSDSWTYIKKVNITGSSTATLSMKGYTQYKIRVYAWNTATIGKYIGGSYSSNAYWLGGPSCTFTAYKNCTLAQ